MPNLALAAGSDVFGLLQAGRFCVTGIAPEVVAAAFGAAAAAELTVTGSGFAAAPPRWDEVAATVIRPDGHLAWAADRADAQAAAGAAAAVRAWLPGSTGARQPEPAAGLAAGQADNRPGRNQAEPTASGQAG